MTLPDSLLAGLRDALGSEHVLDDPSALEAYRRDLSTLGHLAFASGRWDLSGFRPPDAVVRPASVPEVQAVVRLCQQAQVPLVPWGAGSGVCGGSVAVRGGVALDLKRLDRVRTLVPESLYVEVEAGMNGQLFEDRLQRAGLTLGHFPSSITCSTVGGWVAARGAGQLSGKYGKIEDMVLALEVVLPDGRLVRTPLTPRAATGPDWNQVFVGSEGVLGVVTAAVFRIARLPRRRSFAAFEFPDLGAAFRGIRDGLQSGASPAAVRLYDPLDTLLVARSGDPAPAEDADAVGSIWPLSAFSPRRLLDTVQGAVKTLAQKVEHTALEHPELLNRLTETLPGVGCLLVLTFEGEPELVRAEEAVFTRACLAAGAESKGPAPAERWWRNRLAVSFKQSGVYLQGGFVDTMEVATTWDRLEELHTAVRRAVAPHALVMAHFSHAYPEGCSIYFTFAALRADTPEETFGRYRRVWKAGLDAVLACGAAVSHHHGIGTLKADALKASHGDLHDVLARVKQALDPANVLNPGKLGLP
ncbi:MAG: FAD-binding oxidoreductase [Planctomycetota bacterium]